MTIISIYNINSAYISTGFIYKILIVKREMLRRIQGTARRIPRGEKAGLADFRQQADGNQELNNNNRDTAGKDQGQ